MAIIELQEVSKLYGFGGAATVALEEISLTINKGEFVAVMGPSGSGKSTLMNIIGLLDRPTHGSYTLSSKSVARLRPNQRAKARRDKLGFVFQSTNLLPRLNILENVALPLAYKGVSRVKRLKQAAAVLEQVGLQDREYYLPRQLSGGQLQRAAIAWALVNNPSIIIADEPTGNLDSNASRVVMELFGDLHQLGHTILFVTHNPELTRYASRVVYMRDGTIVHDELTAIGQVSRRARKLMFTLPEKTEEDDLAGVSALMQTIPGSTKDESKPKKAAKPKKPRKTKATKRRKAKK